MKRGGAYEVLRYCYILTFTTFLDFFSKGNYIFIGFNTNLIGRYNTKFEFVKGLVIQHFTYKIFAYSK